MPSLYNKAGGEDEVQYPELPRYLPNGGSLIEYEDRAAVNNSNKIKKDDNNESRETVEIRYPYEGDSLDSLSSPLTFTWKCFSLGLTEPHSSRAITLLAPVPVSSLENFPPVDRVIKSEPETEHETEHESRDHSPEAVDNEISDGLAGLQLSQDVHVKPYTWSARAHIRNARTLRTEQGPMSHCNPDQIRRLVADCIRVSSGAGAKEGVSGIVYVLHDKGLATLGHCRVKIGYTTRDPLRPARLKEIREECNADLQLFAVHMGQEKLERFRLLEKLVHKDLAPHQRTHDCKHRRHGKTVKHSEYYNVEPIVAIQTIALWQRWLQRDPNPYGKHDGRWYLKDRWHGRLDEELKKDLGDEGIDDHHQRLRRWANFCEDEKYSSDWEDDEGDSDSVAATAINDSVAIRRLSAPVCVPTLHEFQFRSPSTLKVEALPPENCSDQDIRFQAGLLNTSPWKRTELEARDIGRNGRGKRSQSVGGIERKPEMYWFGGVPASDSKMPEPKGTLSRFLDTSIFERTIISQGNFSTKTTNPGIHLESSHGGDVSGERHKPETMLQEEQSGSVTQKAFTEPLTTQDLPNVEFQRIAQFLYRLLTTRLAEIPPRTIAQDLSRFRWPIICYVMLAISSSFTPQVLSATLWLTLLPVLLMELRNWEFDVSTRRIEHWILGREIGSKESD